MTAPKISERQLKVLEILAAPEYEEGYGIFFRTIAKRTRLSVPKVRIAVRALARKGLAEYLRGLFDEYDGLLIGSGYTATRAGRDLIKARHD